MAVVFEEVALVFVLAVASLVELVVTDVLSFEAVESKTNAKFKPS